jgi:hypothetical protein
MRQSLFLPPYSNLRAEGVSMKYSRRRVIKYLSLLPFMGVLETRGTSLARKQLNENYVMVNGWILKRSDLVEEFE